MSEGIKTIIFPVDDLAKGKALYGKLTGVEPYADQPYYVGYRVGGHEIGLDPSGHRQGMTGPVGYWAVDDMESAVKALVEAGAEVQREPRDVGGGLLIATLTDPDGNVIGLRGPVLAKK
jgi:predicted enzyme related to lactoylglutathione lyase